MNTPKNAPKTHARDPRNPEFTLCSQAIVWHGKSLPIATQPTCGNCKRAHAAPTEGAARRLIEAADLAERAQRELGLTDQGRHNLEGATRAYLAERDALETAHAAAWTQPRRSEA